MISEQYYNNNDMDPNGSEGNRIATIIDKHIHKDDAKAYISTLTESEFNSLAKDGVSKLSTDVSKYVSDIMAGKVDRLAVVDHLSAKDYPATINATHVLGKNGAEALKPKKSKKSTGKKKYKKK